MAGPDAAADLALVHRVRGRTPLLIGDVPTLQLLACVRATSNIPGVLAEAGVFAGGSARLICEAKGDRALHLFDVFETLQAETAAGTPLPSAPIFNACTPGKQTYGERWRIIQT